MANRGGSDLVVDEVGSDCSCSGLEVQEEGTFRRVESLTIRAGEAVDLVARVAGRGRPGEPMRTEVWFRTNEPGRPRRSIPVAVGRVTGVAVVPTSVVFGELVLGGEARQMIEVRDVGGRPLVLARAENLVGDQADVRLVEGDPDEQREGATGGRLVGRCEVTARPKAAGPISGRVRLHLSGPDVAMTVDVPVSGQAVPPVSVTPAVLVLPRASERGPVYDAVCVCRNRSGKRLDLSVESAPPSLSVEVEPGPAPTRAVKVRWDPPAGGGGTGRGTVRLKAAGEGLELPVEIAVELQGQGGSG